MQLCPAVHNTAAKADSEISPPNYVCKKGKFGDDGKTLHVQFSSLALILCADVNLRRSWKDFALSCLTAILCLSSLQGAQMATKSVVCMWLVLSCESHKDARKDVWVSIAIRPSM